MHSIGAALKAWRESEKLSQREAAAHFGVPARTYQDYERDLKAPGAGAIQSFMRAGINANWLLAGEGPMLKGPSGKTDHSNTPCCFWPNPDGEPGLQAWERWAGMVDKDAFVPVIYAPRLAVAAGNDVINYFAAQETEALMFKRSSLQHLGVCPHQVFCMRVKGDSMAKTLPEGVIIMVDTAQRKVSEGIYVIRVGDQLLVRRLQLTPGNKIIVSSDNTAYKPSELNAASLAEHELDVIGRAILVGSKL